jgi:hypothetical protein
MSSHNEHTAHEHHGVHAAHGSGTRAEHGPVAHVAPTDWQDAYTRALAAAQLAPGRTVVVVDLEPTELDWEFTPGRSTRAWGFRTA